MFKHGQYPWWFRVALSRPPDVRIGPGYLDRWHLIPRNRFFNIYLHHFMRSDDDRAMHDHPWPNFSYLLKGSYIEHTIESGGVNKRKLYNTGEWKLRSAKYAHRVELLSDRDGPVPCWSLFVTGPKIRDWGFHCPNGWRHWTTMTDEKGNRVGKGCGEE